MKRVRTQDGWRTGFPLQPFAPVFPTTHIFTTWLCTLNRVLPKPIPCRDRPRVLWSNWWSSSMPSLQRMLPARSASCPYPELDALEMCRSCRDLLPSTNSWRHLSGSTAVAIDATWKGTASSRRLTASNFTYAEPRMPIPALALRCNLCGLFRLQSIQELFDMCLAEFEKRDIPRLAQVRTGRG